MRIEEMLQPRSSVRLPRHINNEQCKSEAAPTQHNMDNTEETDRQDEHNAEQIMNKGVHLS